MFELKGKDGKGESSAAAKGVAPGKRTRSQARYGGQTHSPPAPPAPEQSEEHEDYQGGSASRDALNEAFGHYADDAGGPFGSQIGADLAEASGQDLSNVRIHTNAAANEMADS